MSDLFILDFGSTPACSHCGVSNQFGKVTIRSVKPEEYNGTGEPKHFAKGYSCGNRHAIVSVNRFGVINHVDCFDMESSPVLIAQVGHDKTIVLYAEVLRMFADILSGSVKVGANREIVLS